MRYYILTASFILGLVISLVACSPQQNTNQAEHSEATQTAAETANETTAAVEETPEEAMAHSYAINVDEEGRALHGYDPVAYFTNGEPQAGDLQFTATWNGATWYFVNAENRDAFLENPEKYAPANGGYCTFGVVLGKKFDGDPNVWSIYNEDLFVFLNEEVKEKFLQDVEGNMAKVQDNWTSIMDKSPEELAEEPAEEGDAANAVDQNEAEEETPAETE